MNDRLMYLYLRARNAVEDVLAGEHGEAGLSKLAITVILLAVGVALTLAVVAVVAPEILGLAEDTALEIQNVPLTWDTE